MTTETVCMTSEEFNQSLETAKLEQAYERTLRQAERIYEEERTRVLRVQILLLEDENDGLQDRITSNDTQLDRLEDGYDELRQQLLDTEVDLQKAQADLKNRIRDTERYKAEAQALSASTSDTAKVLTEKLALARELANLKPELEHLKSQATTQQNVLAEKLSLQREVSALQVELEMEKRAVQRIKSQEKSLDRDPTLGMEIEELKKDLAKERRDAQKSERENKKKLMEWETQKDVLDGKLDAFRTKLRTTKEQLKEAQDELERTQAAQFAKSAELTAARVSGTNPKKRSIPHFDPDMTIGTPGNGRPAAKKARISKKTSEPAPAEKNAFSITPFLNRTLSILPESPSQTEVDPHQKADEEINKHIDKIAAEADEASPSTKMTERPAKKTVPAFNSKNKSPQPLKESTNSKANAAVQKQRLAKVVEEEDEENEVMADSPPSFSPQPIKKQKLLLKNKKTLFDGSEEGAERAPARRKLGLGLGLRGGGGSAFADLSFVGQGKTLAAFSPLKKDKRAAAGA